MVTDLCYRTFHCCCGENVQPKIHVSYVVVFVLVGQQIKGERAMPHILLLFVDFSHCHPAKTAYLSPF